MYVSNQLHTCSWPYGYLFPLGLGFYNVLTAGNAPINNAVLQLVFVSFVFAL